jgi:hypothetical protein
MARSYTVADGGAFCVPLRRHLPVGAASSRVDIDYEFQLS